MKRAILWCVMIGTLVAAFSLVGACRSERVLLLMPSIGVMGREFFPILERFEEIGVAVDVAAGVTGPYEFWEDSTECRDSEAWGGYEYTVTLAIEDVNLSSYGALLIAPGHAHSFWVQPGNKRARELILQAADDGMPLGGMSWGVWVLLANGLLDGRTACNWPHPIGIVKESLHWSGFLANFDVEFVPGCVRTDLGSSGQSPIVTANYRCPGPFADAIAELLGVAIAP
jgi:hypothetical protein